MKYNMRIMHILRNTIIACILVIANCTQSMHRTAATTVASISHCVWGYYAYTKGNYSALKPLTNHDIQSLSKLSMHQVEQALLRNTRCWIPCFIANYIYNAKDEMSYATAAHNAGIYLRKCVSNTIAPIVTTGTISLYPFLTYVAIARGAHSIVMTPLIHGTRNSLVLGTHAWIGMSNHDTLCKAIRPHQRTLHDYCYHVIANNDALFDSLVQSYRRCHGNVSTRIVFTSQHMRHIPLHIGPYTIYVTRHLIDNLIQSAHGYDTPTCNLCSCFTRNRRR